MKNKRLFISCIIIILFGVGCILFYLVSKQTKDKSKITFAVDEVMKVGNQSVTMDEFLLYAVDVYQGYNLQGEADWDSKVPLENGEMITYEEKVKLTICEQIRMTKILCESAKDKHIELLNDEKDLMNEKAISYYEELTKDKEIDKKLTVELVSKFYQENLLAQKIYKDILSQCPSDEEVINSDETLDDEQDLEDSQEENSEDIDSQLTNQETYFLSAYSKLEKKYDKQYNFTKSINWDLLKQLSFAEIGSTE